MHKKAKKHITFCRKWMQRVMCFLCCLSWNTLTSKIGSEWMWILWLEKLQHMTSVKHAFVELWCFGNWVFKWRKELKFYRHGARKMSLFSLWSIKKPVPTVCFPEMSVSTSCRRRWWKVQKKHRLSISHRIQTSSCITKATKISLSRFV